MDGNTDQPATHLVMEATDGGSLILPEGKSLTEAEFTQDGSDLVMTFPDGSTVVVEDFFTQANPPKIVAADGAQVPGEVAAQMAGAPASSDVAIEAPQADALSAGTDGAQPGVGLSQFGIVGQFVSGTDGAPIGQVHNAAGEVFAVRADGSRVLLKVGDQVFQGDILETGEAGAVGIVLADKTTFSMAQNGRMVLDEMIYDPSSQTGSVSMSVLKGVFTFVSGQVAKTDPDAMTLSTPVATIGIRGTQVGLEIPDGKNLNVVLMEEADGFVGEVVVYNAGGTRVMNGANDWTVVRSFNSIADTVKTIQQNLMVDQFRPALEHLPTPDHNQNDFGVKQAVIDGGPSVQDLANFQTDAGPQQTAPTETIKVIDGNYAQAGTRIETVEVQAPPPPPPPQETQSSNTTNDDNTVVVVSDDPNAELKKDLEEAGLSGVSIGTDGSVTATVTGNADLSGSTLNFNLTGSDDINTIVTGSGSDYIIGSDGDDYIIAGTGQGHDTYIGGAGNDTIAFTSATKDNPLYVNLLDREEDGVEIGVGRDLNPENPWIDIDYIREIENVIGGAGNDIIIGNSDDNILNGGDGDDTLIGGGGNDTLIGGEGNDTVIFEGNRDDYTRVDNEDGSITFTRTLEDGTVESDTVSGVENIEFTDGKVVLPSSPTEDAMLVGGEGNDVIEGGSGNDTLIGGAGNDILKGQAGDDIMDGGDGDDIFFGGIGNNIINGGAGFDTAIYEGSVADFDIQRDDATGDITVTGDFGVDILTDVERLDFADGSRIWADDGVDNIVGSAFDDIIFGGGGDDIIDGGAGNDIIEGGSGNDILIGGDGDDTLIGGAGDDRLIGGAGDDFIDGGEGIDTALFGGTFGDYTFGATTVDGQLTITVSGPDGTDTITGVELFEFADSVFSLNQLLPPATPDLSAVNAIGAEDTEIPLEIGLNLDGMTGSETLSIVISGVPDGASLNYNGEPLTPVEGQQGVYAVTQEQLDGLTLVPAQHHSGDFEMTVTVTATGLTGATSTTSGTFTVDVEAVADAPVLSLTANVSGVEDLRVPLDISIAAVDPSESLSLSISNIPAGSKLFAGTVPGTDIPIQVPIVNGVAQVPLNQLDSILFQPPKDFSGVLNLTVTATSTEPDNGDQATTVGTISLDIAGVVDIKASDIHVSGSVGLEDNAIALSIGVTERDIDGSESISIVIGNVPEGAVLSAGTDNGDGTYTLTMDDLDGLTITPALNSNVDFNLVVTTMVTDGADVKTFTNDLPVNVTGVADLPVLELSDAAGFEGGTIPLDITAMLTDTDGSESLSIVVSGIPAGVSVWSDGIEIPLLDGAVTLTPDQIDGLSISAPIGLIEDFTLTVTATSTEDDGDSIAVSGTILVDMDNIVDPPVLVLNDAVGDEDTAIPLDIVATLSDMGLGAVVDDTIGGLLGGGGGTVLEPVVGEVLTVTISGVPEGATLSAGTDNGDGSWTLNPLELVDLKITPPANSNEDMTLTVTATATENGLTETTVGTLRVDVVGVADAADLQVQGASGVEDQAVPLNIVANLTDTDGSETLSIVISGVPEGATLSAGTPNGDGSYLLTPEQLQGLTLTPPPNSGDDFVLAVTAITTENDGDTTSVTSELPVDLRPDADQPVLNVSDAAGLEDTAIPVDISSALMDTDGSESLSVVIGGVPEGAVLSAGTDNGDGTWSLTADQLDGLTVTPPANSNKDFVLTVTATAIEGENGDTATTTGTVAVSVTGVADAAQLEVGAARGGEDADIPLSISAALTDTDGSETLSIVISGVPMGAVLSAGTMNPDGSWTLTAADLDGLTITPPAGSDEDFELTVAATTTEDDGDTTTVTGTMTVTVDAVADAPTLVLSNATGDEDTGIPLDISSALTDTDGSETLSIVIGGVPSGATLSAGTDNGDGTWTLTSDQLDGLTVTPPANSNVDFDLTVTAVSTETANGDTASTTGTIHVDVKGVADAPTLSVSLGEGVPVPGGSGETTLTVSNVGYNAGYQSSYGYYIKDADGNPTEGKIIWANAKDTVGETFSIEGLDPDSVGFFIIPNGANMNNNVQDGMDVTFIMDANGQWDAVGPNGQVLKGAGADALYSDPALNPGGLEHATDSPDAGNQNWEDLVGGGDNDFNDANFNVTWDVQPGGPTSTDYPLNIEAALTDTDGSETLSITVAGIPDSVTLSAGTHNADGSWTLTPAQLDGLTMNVPTGVDAGFAIDVTATSTEDDGDSASVTASVNADIDTTASAPELIVSDASGDEDTAIALDLSAALTDTDGSESLSITVSGMPEGAMLSAGTYVGDGVWTLTPDQFDGLTLTPPLNSDVDFELTVTATSTESQGGAQTSATGTVHIDLNAVADAATLTVSNVTGDEDTAIPLDIQAGLTDTDGSETLSIAISGMPAGASLSAGTQNSDGSWTLTPDQLSGLVLIPPHNSDVDFALTVTATTVEASNGEISEVTQVFDVFLNGVPDAPTLSAENVSGAENTAIPLDIAAALTDTDGSETLSIVIGGVPSGALLSAGTDNGDGTWTLTSGDLDGLTVTPAHNSNVDFNLTVTATSTESATGGTAQTSAVFHVDVKGVADEPTLSVSLGEPMTIPGGEPVDVTIDVSNVTSSGAGFSVMGRSINSNGTLSEPSADKLSFHENPVGFGVKGSASGADTELGYSNAAGKSEQIVVAFDNDVSSVDVQFAWLNNQEDAKYELYKDGVKVGEGIVTGITDQVDPAVTLSANGAAFDRIVFSAPGSGDDYLINSIGFTTFQGGETVVEYPLNIETALTDTDGSETLSIVVAGIPEGATLSAGTKNTDGTWSVPTGDLEGLKVSVPQGMAGSLNVTVTAISTENDGDTASVSASVGVQLDMTASAPTLSAADVSGDEDSAIPLNISSALTDTDGSETLSIVIGGVPSGAALSAGIDNGDGTWTLTSDDLGGLTITPPADSNADFDLTVKAVSTEAASGDTAETQATVRVAVTGVADAPILSAALGEGEDIVSGHPSGGGSSHSGHGHGSGSGSGSGSGQGGGEVVGIEYPVEISALLADTDGSETLSVSISGVPAGVTFNKGTDAGNGTWMFAPSQLSGLSMTVPASVTADFSLTVSAKATEDDGDTATVLATLDVEAPAPEGVSLTGGSGKDTLAGGAGDDTIKGLGGNDTITGGGGNDALYGDQAWEISGEGRDTIDGGAGDDLIVGGGNKDKLYGGSGNDTIYGDHMWATNNDGKDTIEGGSGDDTLFGGGGADKIYAGSSSGESATDGNNLIYGDQTTFYANNDGADTIVGGGGNDTVYGGGGNDVITGGAGDDRLFGGVENDYYDSRGGDDTIDGGAGNDHIEGGAGNDLLFGGDGDDVIYGDIAGANWTGGNDTIYGGAGNDRIDGGAGDDIIYGGAGNDILTGGSGKDEFHFDAGSGHDIVKDIFNQDKLVFDGQEFDIADLRFGEDDKGDVVISFQGQDTKVTLEGVKTSQLDRNNDGQIQAGEGYTVTEDSNKVTIQLDPTPQ